MNILIITANPREDSLTNFLAKTYSDIKAKDNSVEIIDLYKTDYKQSFFDESREFTEAQKYFHEKIKNTDEFVFFYPFWWGGHPAILKNWIDNNFSHGVAFEYGARGPVGLLKEKTVRVFLTTGAPKDIYDKMGINGAGKKIWEETIINFTGMKLSGFHTYGTIGKQKDIVKKTIESVKAIALL